METLGTEDPHADLEVIALGMRFFEALGLERVSLRINSLGDFDSRPLYQVALAEYFRRRRGDLSEQARATLKRNPLRVLDSKRPKDQPVIAEAPAILHFLSGPSMDHFLAIRAGLNSLRITYDISPRLVRGLDYYCHTTFEFVVDTIDAAQNAVGGGGRYDRLVEELGGPPTPGVGFALGVDRILLACDAEGVFAPDPAHVQVFVVDTTGGDRALVLVRSAPTGGLGCGPGLRQPVHEGPDEAGRPLRRRGCGDCRPRRAGYGQGHRPRHASRRRSAAGARARGGGGRDQTLGKRGLMFGCARELAAQSADLGAVGCQFDLLARWGRDR